MDEFKDAYLTTIQINSIERLEKWLKEVIDRTFTIIQNSYTEVSPFVKRVINYIEENYMQNINLKTIAAEFKINPVYLGYLFKKETGGVFTNYLNNIRIDSAKKLLDNSRNKINEISEKVGYTNISYFNSIFRKLEGISPADYRRSKKSIR